MSKLTAEQARELTAKAQLDINNSIEGYIPDLIDLVIKDIIKNANLAHTFTLIDVKKLAELHAPMKIVLMSDFDNKYLDVIIWKLSMYMSGMGYKVSKPAADILQIDWSEYENFN